MKDFDNLCIVCKEPVEKIPDKDYPKLIYRYCNNSDCPRLGLLTVIFKTQRSK